MDRISDPISNDPALAGLGCLPAFTVLLRGREPAAPCDIMRPGQTGTENPMQKLILILCALAFAGYTAIPASADDNPTPHHKCRKGYVATESGVCIKPNPQ
jgi:hypothetical protein